MPEFQGLAYVHPFTAESEEHTRYVDTLSFRRIVTYSGAQRFGFVFSLEPVRADDPRIGTLYQHAVAHGVRVPFRAPIPQRHVPVRRGSSVALTKHLSLIHI